MLDGFIAGPNGEFDAFEPSVEEHQFANELFGAMDSILLERKTYEGFISYWDALDTSDDSIPAMEREFAHIFSNLHRVVFSRTLEQVPENTTLIKDDLAAQLTALKTQPGRDLILVCGPDLLATLVGLALVDEYCLNPSNANTTAFDVAIDEIAAVTHKFFAALETNATPKNREEEAAKARERSAKRFSN